MNTGRRRCLIASTAMLATAAVATAAKPHRQLAEVLSAFRLEDAVPVAFGRWSIDPNIVPVLPSPDVAAALNKIYNQVLNRTYVREDGQRVMLSIAYGGAQTQQLRAHRQEVCYSAQGFQISDLLRVNLRIAGALIPATRMVAKHGERVEPVTYWFTMGSYAVMSLLDRQRVQFLYSLRGLIPDGFLFRMSSIEPDKTKAFGRHIAFAEELLAATDHAVGLRLLGREV